MRFFGFGHPDLCLDEAFDAPDIAADRELCRAIVAGRSGLHPDAWGGQWALTAIMPLGFPGSEYRPLLVSPYDQNGVSLPIDPEWEAKHRRRPVEEPKPKRRPRPAWKWSREPPPPIADQWWARNGTEGTVQLTCDECGEKFRQTADYGHGKRDAAAVMLRQMGHTDGWTRIVGTDRCPDCSIIHPRARRHTRPHKLPRLPRTEQPPP